VVGRLHDGAAGRFLWLDNPTRSPIRARPTVDGADLAGRLQWGSSDSAAELEIPGRDAIIIALKD
jgi:hypothetical protein